jgi:hypothetical protein
MRSNSSQGHPDEHAVQETDRAPMTKALVWMAREA